MTESAVLSIEGQRDSFNDLEVENFEVLETLDTTTCDLCGAMDGKVFPMSEFKIGVTAPVFHPNCRSDVIPAIDEDFGERIARDKDGNTVYVPSEMKYSEWKERFLSKSEKSQAIFEEKGLTNRSAGGIMGAGGGIMGSENNYILEARAKIGTTDYPLTLNEGHQTKHIEGSHNFDPARGTLTANPEELIRLYAGKSYPRPTNAGVWNQKEWFEHTSQIGIWRNSLSGDEAVTTKGLLHYSKKGVHIVPSDPKGDYND